MRRQRNQKGSLQLRKHGRKKMWVFLYREGTARRYVTLGSKSELTKSQAEEKREKILNELKSRQAAPTDTEITFGVFVEGVALPFQRSKWKRSTASTTEHRIRFHLLPEFREALLQRIGLKSLQEFLRRKAESLSKSVVEHLRWDLRSIFKIAMAEGYLDRDPTGALYTPRDAKVGVARVMNREEVERHIQALDFRERVIDHLALFAGMRPGEILGLQRRHVSDDCREITIDQRLYRGDIDTPKTQSSKRTVAIPPQTALLLSEWMLRIDGDPQAWVFPSENLNTPIWRDNAWYRHMRPKLAKVGLAWANFQVLRRTHASLGHEAGIDPKVAADQRGHGIGVALDVYTHASIERRAQAAEQLEKSVLVN